jgi:hypothetical protein
MRRPELQENVVQKGVSTHQLFDNLADNVARENVALLNSRRFFRRNANGGIGDIS